MFIEVEGGWVNVNHIIAIEPDGLWCKVVTAKSTYRYHGTAYDIMRLVQNAGNN